MLTKEKAHEIHHHNHYLLQCPHCGNEIVATRDEFKEELFKPHEEEYEYWRGHFTEDCRKIGKQLVSSDPSKDTYEIKCPVCGHIWREYVNDMYDKRCNPDGSQSIIFDLGEEMTKKAKKFIEQHKHTEELKKRGKLAFSALGHQFTYHIIPGGLGDIVTIECNQCHEKEDITNVENW